MGACHSARTGSDSAGGMTGTVTDSESVTLADAVQPRSVQPCNSELREHKRMLPTDFA